MRSDIAISARNLSKEFRIGSTAQVHSTLAETLLQKIRNPRELLGRKTDSFMALNDLNFEIHKGEVMGIIGRNGAGKSTLLKILSRITEPSAGEIDVYGRIGSLLEVGTGFHPELTGRENIYLNGQILGMRKREIDQHFDAIVDFAGVEKFLETPVKRYSSGMYVRLAFAVAAHLNSDILIVDEVLAVGDSEFQRRCLGKMKDVATSGRTVLLVSHHMQSVQFLCDRCIYLNGGKLAFQGDVGEATEMYARGFGRPAENAVAPTRRSGSGEYRITSAVPTKEFFDCGEAIEIDFELHNFHGSQPSMFISAHIVDEMSIVVTQCDSRLGGKWYGGAPRITGSLTVEKIWLKPGRYRVDMYVCVHGFVDIFEGACEFTISPKLPYSNTISADGIAKGVVLSDFNWTQNNRAVGKELAALSV